MNALKPCPFCKGEAALWSSYGKFGYFVYCKCEICGATSKTFPLGESLPEDWGELTASRKAADAWNRRCCDAEQDH
ncbi:MAG: hypothetical protein HFE94_05725 [Acutalibacter sp.]|nr:hypothetical protein [Acutalibacter sp.]